MAEDDRKKRSNFSGIPAPKHSQPPADLQYTPISSPSDVNNEDSSCGSLDAPLDFSVKRRNNDHDVGTAPTANSSRAREDFGAVKTEPELLGVVKSEATSPRRSNGLSSVANGIRPLSADRYHQPKIGEPQLAMPSVLPGALLPGAGMGMFPVFPTALLNGLPGAQDISIDTKGENGRAPKSLKGHHGKEALKLASPTTGMPMLYNVDLAAAQGMAATSEEMFTQYRNYIMALQDQMKLQTSPGGSSTSSTSQGPTANELYSAMHSPSERPEGHHEPSLSQQSPSTTDTSPPMPGTTIGGGAPSSSRSLYTRVPSTHSRRRGRTLPEEQKDELYWERRRKNNEAAKRSRDARRAKEDEIAIRAAFLEQENLKLRVEVAALKNETAKLRCMLYNS
ncbi:hypothetical protein LSH36_670g00040 [Paralvinella palmiformis]|uniref:BZIP domain-containing protein n=1 Tax=Paralvinella palmiformis TaxID=53620 RepID=A0AAD9MTU6_9ANNE|nr:hypothetical protein LSH36_670g00040 [Paralvinella palmiformis]